MPEADERAGLERRMPTASAVRHARAPALVGADMRAVTANSLAVASWTIFGRLTGLGRAIAIAAVLGPTYFGNLFQATNMIPNLIYEFLAGNLIVALLVPPLVRHTDVSNHDHASILAGRFLAVLLTVFALVSVVIIAAGPLLLDFLAFGVRDAAVRADQRSAGWVLLALLVPQVMLYAVAGVGMAVQHSCGRYRLATAAYSLENLGVIAVVIASGMVHGTGVPVGSVTTAQLLFLGIGTTAAVGLHAAAQWYGAWRAGILLRPRLGWADDEVRSLLRLGIPSLGYAGLNGLRLITLVAVAGSVRGGVVAFQMALSFYYLPVAIGALPVVWAMVPLLSRLYRHDDVAGFQLQWARGLSMSLFVVVPAVAGYLALAPSLARVVSLGEMATETGVALVSASLLALAVGIIGDTVFMHASYGSYARSDARGPFRAMAVRVALLLAGVAVTVQITPGRSMLVALGLAVTISNIVSGGFLCRHIVRGPAKVLRGLLGSTTRASAAAAAMAIPVYFIGRATTLPLSQEAVLVGALAVLGCGTYLLVQRGVFRSPEFRLLSSQFGAIFRGGGE